MAFASTPYWIIFSSLEGSTRDTTDHIVCGPAVTAQSNLFLLQLWLFTKRSHLEHSDFFVDAVKKMCTVLPPRITTPSMTSCLPSPMSP